MIDAFTTLAEAFAPRAVVVAQAPDRDATELKRALGILAGLQKGTIDRSGLSSDLSSAYTATVLANDAKTIPAGDPARVTQSSKTDSDGVTSYVFRLGWKSGTLDYVFGVDDATDKIVKLYTRPGPPA